MFRNAKWRYRGEFEQEFGIRQASAFIEKGKFEKGEDSDGDSVYRKVTVGDTHKVGKKRNISLSKTARVGKCDDLAILDKEADDFSSLGDTIKNRKEKTRKTKPLATGDRPEDDDADGPLAILDAAVPPDDSVTGERSTAASKGKSMAAKLSAKADGDIAAMCEALRKRSKSDDASAVYLQQAKEVKTHIAATAKALIKKARVDLEKMDVESVKDLRQKGAECSGKWKPLLSRVRPIIKPPADKKEKAPSRNAD